jgi:ABC-type transport system substrate-binding protein
MQNIVGMLASSFGIPPQLASTAMTGVTRMFLQKSTPKTASGLLNTLPKDVTNQFSESEKQKFTTTAQANLYRYDLIKQLSESTGIKDIDKLDNLADAILDSIKKNAKIDTSDGIDKQELIEAMKDFSKDHSGQA